MTVRKSPGGGSDWRSYDGVAGIYAGSAERRFRPLADALVERVGSKPGLPVLDIGTGTGLVLKVLRERLGPRAPLIGVDPSGPMLERIPEEVSVHRLRAVAPGLPFRAGSVGTVTANLVLSHVSDPRAALGDMARVARPGGRIVFSAWASTSVEEDEQRDLVQQVLAEVAAAVGVDHPLPESPAPWEDHLRDEEFIREVAATVSDTVTVERVGRHNRLTAEDLLAGWGSSDRFRRSVASPDAWSRYVRSARQRLLDEVGPEVTSYDEFWIVDLVR